MKRKLTPQERAIEIAAFVGVVAILVIVGLMFVALLLIGYSAGGLL